MTAASDRDGLRFAGAAGDTLLVRAAALFTVAVLVHNADHVRRGADAVASDVFWVGTSAIALEVGIVVLACMRHRLAALVAAASGAALAVGYVVVHFTPARRLLSDTLLVDAASFSRLAAVLEVVAAVALATCGWAVLSARGGLAGVGAPRRALPLRRAFRNPLVLAMAGGNAVVLVASFVQLSG